MIPKFKKKAILFSLISVLFAILFVTLFSQNLTTIYEDRLPGSNIRIKVIDTYTRNFEKYLGDSIKVSTYKTLDAITVSRRITGTFFTNGIEFNNTFRGCMTCGYANCSNITVTNNCNITGYSLKARLDNITNLSLNQLNIKTNYIINSINIEQKNAFDIDVTVNISYNITDNSAGENYASWTKQQVITQSVPIIGLLDPKGYINDTTKKYQRTIQKYSGICEYDESCWNFTNVEIFYKENSFRQYQGGGSFLNRYWNDISPSECCGIETILHPVELTGPDKNNSYIDNQYWNLNHKCNSNTIVNLSLNSDDIHLDQTTAARYHVTNSSTRYCTP